MNTARYGYGIRRTSDSLWFGGFGPAPGYEVRWFPEDAAYPFAKRESAEMQSYLLWRADRPVEMTLIP